MLDDLDVIIIGGGLAGLTAALHLNKVGLNVTLVEKQSYPQHKVCGEYISNEVLPYLNWLGLDMKSLSATAINKLQLSTVYGKSTFTKLPLGGFGISRYELDYFLYQQLLKNGVRVIIDTVVDVFFKNEIFEVSTSLGKLFTAKQVIGAYGKRSSLDIKFNRPFIQQKSHYLAVKSHYKGNFPKDLVALHHFNGGYCGVSMVENQNLNICYLADYNSFKAYKNIDTYQKEVLYKNQNLKQIFEQSEILFEAPLTISQVSFAKKSKIENHMLMIGDSAGLIHPLCGNGMAMAIHAAKIASELMFQFANGEINRAEMETNYEKSWQQNFNGRLKMGSLLSTLFRNQKTTNFLISAVTKSPFLLNQIIKKTHGNKISIHN
ncbi:NAD(P)/FAD-dependent oxidoreductase [Pedobacter cryotolerans]|uniref:NAD(P)/FAD-dependent oxidoreductase n=1 Tax=Pedobacter cryotolerans TaxID=2571270 RepID=A0A4U1BZL0_9SPHI|nr:NAD(P)/FAD-dependent oxidoreductase [Pedobacter cryotolerans]TKB97986.1 NAD(P)/FAD-dependent oxidoreductase [Pedobacter cryotolerans]